MCFFFQKIGFWSDLTISVETFKLFRISNIFSKISKFRAISILSQRNFHEFRSFWVEKIFEEYHIGEILISSKSCQNLEKWGFWSSPTHVHIWGGYHDFLKTRNIAHIDDQVKPTRHNYWRYGRCSPFKWVQVNLDSLWLCQCMRPTKFDMSIKSLNFSISPISEISILTSC